MRRQISPWVAGAQDVEEGVQVQRHDFGPAPSSSGPPSLDYRMNEEALSRRAVCRLRVSLLNMAPSQLPPIPAPCQKGVLFAKTPPRSSGSGIGMLCPTNADFKRHAGQSPSDLTLVTTAPQDKQVVLSLIWGAFQTRKCCLGWLDQSLLSGTCCILSAMDHSSSPFVVTVAKKRPSLENPILKAFPAQFSEPEVASVEGSQN